jgi:predicted ATP-dependent endonuclease of OLD family
MKIKRIKLENYKRFQSREFSFHDDLTLITGNNGEGKTSLMQAIASVIGGAVRDHFNPSDLDWPGFNFRYIQPGRSPVQIEVDLKFEQSEVDATILFCKDLNKINPEKFLTPPNKTNITIQLDYEENKVRATKKSGINAFFLTKGYQYAKMLESKDKNFGKRFEKVGSILWYDEQRTSNSVTKELISDFDFNQTNITKEIVSRWYFTHLDFKERGYQLREGQFDKFSKLKEIYEKVFQGRKLVGATLNKGGGNGIDVLFSDGKNEYDISEFSAGERAIFPILLDFSNQKINNSIILIDEIELHLHPPLQQKFIDMLPHLGINNQFIISTHSPFVASQFSDDQKLVIKNE